MSEDLNEVDFDSVLDSGDPDAIAAFLDDDGDGDSLDTPLANEDVVVEETTGASSGPIEEGVEAEEAPKLASEALSIEGIPGIRYLDAFSRGAGEGQHNYVIFNDADVSIEARFALRGDETRNSLKLKPETTDDGEQILVAGDLVLFPVNELELPQNDLESFDNDDADLKPGHLDSVEDGAQVWTVDAYLKDKDGEYRAVATAKVQMRNGQITAIHDIDAMRKGQGAGEHVVAAILASAPGEVKIVEAVNEAQGLPRVWPIPCTPFCTTGHHSGATASFSTKKGHADCWRSSAIWVKT